MVATALAAAGCGGDPDPGAGAERDSNQAGIRPDPVVDELVERCAWGSECRSKASADDIREAFVRVDDEPVALLVSGTEFRPGEGIDFALDNGTDRSLLYRATSKRSSQSRGSPSTRPSGCPPA